MASALAFIKSTSTRLSGGVPLGNLCDLQDETVEHQNFEWMLNRESTETFGSLTKEQNILQDNYVGNILKVIELMCLPGDF